MKKNTKIRPEVMKAYNEIENKMLKELCKKEGIKSFSTFGESLSTPGVPTKIMACIKVSIEREKKDKL